MNIQKQSIGDKLILVLEGRLDTTTAPQLDAELKKTIDGVKELEFDFAKLKYISSAGLRVILATQKVMNKQGSMLLRNVNDVIMEIFEITGFIDIFTFEESLESAETTKIIA
ncbi:MAG: STAS domain-containing protein [Longicatena sp.]